MTTVNIKKFDASQVSIWAGDTGLVLDNGALSWDHWNGLRLHDGTTANGIQIGSNTANTTFTDDLISNINNSDMWIAPFWDSGAGYSSLKLPSDTNAITNAVQLANTKEGGAGVKIITSNNFNGNTEYDWTFGADGTLTLPQTNVITSTPSSPSGTIITGIESYVGAGAPYNYVWIGFTPNFTSWYNTYSSSLVGWTIYPTNDPVSAVTIIDSAPPVGGPGLGTSGPLGNGPYTAHSADYVPPMSNPVAISINSHNWSFNTDSSLTLPGPINKISVNTVNTGYQSNGSPGYYGDPIYPTAIDLTKSINKLTDNTGSVYTLADGVEGQIMYLVPKDGATIAGIIIIVDNARILDNTSTLTATVIQNASLAPFSTSTGSPVVNIAMLIFTDGAWQSNTGTWS